MTNIQNVQTPIISNLSFSIVFQYLSLLTVLNAPHGEEPRAPSHGISSWWRSPIIPAPLSTDLLRSWWPPSSCPVETCFFPVKKNSKSMHRAPYQTYQIWKTHRGKWYDIFWYLDLYPQTLHFSKGGRFIKNDQSHQGILQPTGTCLALRLHWLEASAIPIDEVLHLHDIHVFDHPLLLWQHEPGQPTSNCHSSSQQKTYKHGGWRCLLGFVMNSIAFVSHLSTWEHHAARSVSWACGI